MRSHIARIKRVGASLLWSTTAAAGFLLVAAPLVWLQSNTPDGIPFWTFMSGLAITFGLILVLPATLGSFADEEPLGPGPGEPQKQAPPPAAPPVSEAVKEARRRIFLDGCRKEAAKAERRLRESAKDDPDHYDGEYGLGGEWWKQ